MGKAFDAYTALQQHLLSRQQGYPHKFRHASMVEVINSPFEAAKVCGRTWLHCRQNRVAWIVHAEHQHQTLTDWT